MASKQLPVTIKSYSSLVKNPKAPRQEIRVRIVKYNNNPLYLLDVRKFSIGASFKGYTGDGVSLTLAQYRHLVSLSKIILPIMEALYNTGPEKDNVPTNAIQEDEVSTQQSEESSRDKLGTQEMGEENISS